jgi:ABC-type transport system involved in multi-copper enzyme maturation permease subunit
MASAIPIRRYGEIVRNTISAILRSKVLYLLLFLSIVIFAISLLPLMVAQMAMEAGESEAALSVTTTAVGNVVGFWVTAAHMFALFLGATAISSEIKTKTIVTILSKPVDRWRFLAAKWVGIEVFLLVFFIVGMAAASLIVRLFDAETTPLFWVGVADGFFKVTIMGTAALALSTISTPVFAGGLPILISILSGLTSFGVEDPSFWLRTLSKAVYFLLPASMPGNLLAESFNVQPLDPDWGLYGQVLLENAGYAFVLLALACIIFQKRELRLK